LLLFRNPLLTGREPGRFYTNWDEWSYTCQRTGLAYPRTVKLIARLGRIVSFKQARVDKSPHVDLHVGSRLDQHWLT
jgi:hypothetical protein